MATVSCVITSYNNGEWLEEAILSVVNQTRPPDEIIVTDDLSSDGSRELIRSMAARYPNVIPLLRKSNLGVTVNRDLALGSATGDYLTTLDGDDYYRPDKIESEMRVIEETDCRIAFSSFRFVDPDQGIDRFEDTSAFAALGPAERLRWMLTRKTCVPHETMVPADLHKGIGGYRHALATWEDWEYTLRLAALPVGWGYSGVEGFVQRGHPGGLSDMPALRHTRERHGAIRLNRELIEKHLGSMGYRGALLRNEARGLKRVARRWVDQGRVALARTRRPAV